ncbi:MAG: hypothetical protein P4L79_04460 [Legionella sp.]|uniref:hypothetical protein n=1 Tax=Legionella sp. TaxID=459 RepID=UPI00283E49B5|nr:hypothetical protein [Legionella sp.]
MMKRMLLGSIGLCMITQAFAVESSGPNNTLLPSPYPVYVIKDAGVVNHSYPGATQVLLPTDNTYAGSPGCYIACYSHSPGLYMVSPTISVMGQVRVRGKYMIRICKPEGYQNMDISKSDQLKGLCTEKIKGCSNNLCWAGGDTGGWFGIP